MNKYQYTDKCAEIFDFRDGSEEICRKIIIAGVEWTDNHPDVYARVSALCNAGGVELSQTDDMVELENAMNKAMGGCCTKSMMYFAVNHVLYAKNKGWDVYIRELEQDGEEEKKELE